MDFLTGNIKTIYFKYLAMAFGGSLISSVYGIVDMAMVGNYQGPDGTSALAIAAPLWNIIFSLGMLMGIGGAVLLSTLRGAGPGNEDASNQFFTAAVIGGAFLSVVVWVGLMFFDTQLLTLFGATEELLPLVKQYILPIKFLVPVYLWTQLLSAFLRNDGDPGLATAAVWIGCLFNIVADYFFIFVMDWGLFGAGFATILGTILSLLIMLAHFFRKRNTLRLVRPVALGAKLWKITVTGFSTFFVDVAMGILTILFNRQIMALLGSNALSVYAIIINISTLVQTCAYSIGQAAQPILSTNFGAKQGHRIRGVLAYALGTVAVLSVVWTVLDLAVPNALVRLFMTPTAEILAIAPTIIRRYSISYLLLPFNIFSTYYFQALMQPGAAFAVSVSRGAVVSGALIYLLPAVAGADAIWFAMPITELVVAVYVAVMMVRYTRRLEDTTALS